MSYILFYSNYCNYSKKFINILENSGEASFFVKICVDKDHKTGQRPPILSKYKITEVPTIIVENRKLPGYSAFKWLHTRIENSQDKVNSLPSRQNKQVVNTKNLAAQKKEPEIEPYFNGSSANFTDSCVQIGDVSSEKINTPGEEEEVDKGTFTLQDDDITATAMNTEMKVQSSVSKDKLKTKQFDNDYNKLLQERDLTTPKPVQRF